MLSIAPASVMLIGIFGMFVVAFAVARITVLERRVQRPAFREPIRREYARTGS